MSEICNRCPDHGIPCNPRTYKSHVSCRHNWSAGRDDLYRVSNSVPTPSFFAKGFEFIADLNNWGKLKPFQDEFVNLFMV
jgi:hypothetical protein